MLNRIEKFKVAILHLNRDGNYWVLAAQSVKNKAMLFHLYLILLTATVSPRPSIKGKYQNDKILISCPCKPLFIIHSISAKLAGKGLVRY